MVAFRPRLFSFLCPYLLIYVAAVGSVGMFTNLAGDPFAHLVASISSVITYSLSIPVTWSSTSLSFIAAGSQPVSLYITQECSGIASISIYLLLIALMHLDMKPRASVSIFFAAAGSLVFLILNAARVVVIAAGGIAGGTSLLWSLHGWVGYVFYIAGYSSIILVFVKVAGAKTSESQSTIVRQLG